MATKVAELRADLTLNSASFESSAQRARREFKQFQQSVAADTSAMQKSLESITGLFKGLAVGAIAAFGTAGVAGAIGAAIKEFKDSEQALLKLQGVLKATGNTTGFTAKQIDDLSNALEATTMATDDMVKAAAARLATFGTVAGTNFKRAIELANDLSAVFGGDVVGAVEKVGNALNNPVEGLKLLTREVRAFSPEVAESAKQLFEMGRAAEAQTLILDELAKRVGGAAEGQNGGLAGQFDYLVKTFQNVGAEILVQTHFIEGLTGAIQAAGAAMNAITGGGDNRTATLNAKAAELDALRRELQNPNAAVENAQLGGSAEDLAARKAAIIERIGVLKEEVDTIVAGMDAEKERAAIAAKSLSDKANASQIAHKAEIKAIADEQVAEKAKAKVITDLGEERRKREAFAASERAKQRQGELASILAAAEEDKRVALAVEEQKKRAAADAAREQERAVEAQTEIVTGFYRRMGEEIQDAIAGSLKSAMLGEVVTAQDVANKIKDIFFTMASQVASLAIFNPSALSGLGGGGTFGQLAPSLLGGTALGGVGIGSTLMAGSLGAAAGGIGAGLLGLNSTGGSLGGGLGAAGGAIIGSLVPGIGTAIGGIAGGALGSIIGGLLGGGGGGGDHNDNYRASFVNGTFANVKNTKPSEGNVNNVTQVGQQIAALYAALQARGGSFTGTLGLNSGNQDGLQLTTAGGTTKYGNVQQLSLAAAKALISGTEGLSTLDRRILGRSKATDAQGLIADLNFADQFAQATGTITPFVAELKNLLRTFDEQDKKAKELGLSLKDLNAAQERQLQNIRDQKSAQIISLQSSFRDRVGGAFGFLDPIQQLRDSFSTNGGTARTRFGAARAEFERVRQQVAAGQVSGFNALPGAAQTLLGAAKENFASGTGYAEISALVRQVLDSALAQGAEAQDPLLDGIGKQTQTIQGLRDELLKERDSIVTELKALRRDIHRLDRAA